MRNTMPSLARRRHRREHRAGSALGVLGVAVVHEQHVDVARVVELASAELAHADDGERPRRSRRSRARCSTQTRAPARRARARPRACRRCRADRGPRPATARVASSAASLRRRGRRSRATGSGTSRACARSRARRVAQRIEHRIVGDDGRCQRARGARERDESRREQRVVGELRRERRVRLDRTFAPACVPSEHRRNARSRRRASGLGVHASSTRSCTQCRVSCSGVSGRVSPPPRSIWSSAISTATSIACSTPTSAPTPPGAISWLPRARRSPATRPKTSCCGRRSSRGAPSRSRSSRPRTGRHRGGRRVRRGAARSRQRGRASAPHGERAGRLPQAPPAELRGVRRAAVLRRRSTVDGPLFVDRRRPRRRLDLRGRVEPDRSDRRQAAGGAELVVNINASPYYAGRLAERERCSPPAPPTRRCRSST